MPHFLVLYMQSIGESLKFYLQVKSRIWPLTRIPRAGTVLQATCTYQLSYCRSFLTGLFLPLLTLLKPKTLSHVWLKALERLPSQIRSPSSSSLPPPSHLSLFSPIPPLTTLFLSPLQLLLAAMLCPESSNMLSLQGPFPLLLSLSRLSSPRCPHGTAKPVSKGCLDEIFYTLENSTITLPHLTPIASPNFSP